MRRLSTRLIVAISSFALAQMASAADLPVKAPVYEPPPPPVYSWTGFYIGANIGGGWGDRNVGYAANDLLSLGLFLPNFPNLNGAPPPASIHTSGVLGGLQVGYNWQMGSAWLIGAEADIDWSGVKGSASTGGALGQFIFPPFVNTVEEKVEWLGTVRARLGYLPTPNLLAFVTGGFAYGEVERVVHTHGPTQHSVPWFVLVMVTTAAPTSHAFPALKATRSLAGRQAAASNTRLPKIGRSGANICT